MIKQHNTPLIYTIDNDLQTQLSVQQLLRGAGYATKGARSAHEGWGELKEVQADLIILELVLPDDDGLTLIEKIRDETQTPIIVLSVVDDDATIVQAFEAEVDDYVTKPFNGAELLGRIKAILRRCWRQPASDKPDKPSIAYLNGLKVDLNRQQVWRNGRLLHFSPIEWKLLKKLLLNAGKIVDHRTLLHYAWGPQYNDETHYLHIYIGHLRRKLETNPREPRVLITEPGMGYRLITDSLIESAYPKQANGAL